MKRSEAYIGASMPGDADLAVALAPWASPHENSAPSICTGRYSVEPRTSWRVSMFPPNVPGGITATALAPAGQTPIVPKNGASGIATLSRR